MKSILMCICCHGCEIMGKRGNRVNIVLFSFGKGIPTICINSSYVTFYLETKLERTMQTKLKAFASLFCRSMLVKGETNGAVDGSRARLRNSRSRSTRWPARAGTA